MPYIPLFENLNWVAAAGINLFSFSFIYAGGVVTRWGRFSVVVNPESVPSISFFFNHFISQLTFQFSVQYWINWNPVD